MTDNVHYLQQDAPVNDNMTLDHLINAIHYNVLSGLNQLAHLAQQSTSEKRAVVNVIDDIARRCDKFLEDV
jgi:hypothetical protein